jgi:hypothetical protein
MTSRAQYRTFVAAALVLWLLFAIQAWQSSLLLDDWFELRYWRDHAFGPTALWQFARFNYFHYNPRIGEVFLALIHGSRAIHLIVTPLVQVALLPTVFVIAFARWPRRNLRDLELLLAIQVLIWLVIPIPGLMYFYRPFATNYLWGFTVTLALFVPYRLALASSHSEHARPWLVPIMLVLGWVAGMCNEHTGPTAMVAIAAFVIAAWRTRRLRAWMLAGLVGLYVGYPMLFFAPGQTVRYAGLATRDTPVKLLAERGLTGCVAIVGDFLYESRLGILLFAATAVSYALTQRFARPPRRLVIETGVLFGSAITIVVTLFMSPTATDRVFFASGVLLVAAFAPWMQQMFFSDVVRRFTVGACIVAFGYHAVRFIQTSAVFASENAERVALLAAAKAGSIVVVPSYEQTRRSRWQFGDDFQWGVRDYIARELYDLERIDLDERDPAPAPHFVAVRSYDPPLAPRHAVTALPTYRELLAAPLEVWLAAELVDRGAHSVVELAITEVGLFDDPLHRPLYVLDWTPSHTTLVDGRPYNDTRGHFIRVRNPPARLESAFITGCGATQPVELIGDLVPVDERFCRGEFTAILCEPERCWIAGWY